MTSGQKRKATSQLTPELTSELTSEHPWDRTGLSYLKARLGEFPEWRLENFKRFWKSSDTQIGVMHTPSSDPIWLARMAVFPLLADKMEKVTATTEYEVTTTDFFDAWPACNPVILIRSPRDESLSPEKQLTTMIRDAMVVLRRHFPGLEVPKPPKVPTSDSPTGDASKKSDTSTGGPLKNTDASTSDAGKKSDASTSDAGKKSDASTSNAGKKSDASTSNAGKKSDASTSNASKKSDAPAGDPLKSPDASASDVLKSLKDLINHLPKIQLKSNGNQDQLLCVLVAIYLVIDDETKDKTMSEVLHTFMSLLCHIFIGAKIGKFVFVGSTKGNIILDVLMDEMCKGGWRDGRLYAIKHENLQLKT